MSWAALGVFSSNSSNSTKSECASLNFIITQQRDLVFPLHRSVISRLQIHSYYILSAVIVILFYINFKCDCPTSVIQQIGFNIRYTENDKQYSVSNGITALLYLNLLPYHISSANQLT